jgi:hypothetical protein
MCVNGYLLASPCSHGDRQLSDDNSDVSYPLWIRERRVALPELNGVRSEKAIALHGKMRERGKKHREGKTN